jgi:GGDEF domain-containing protein
VVAPLFDAGGVVRALLCLDAIPPTRLNESTITIFLGIAEWVSAALSRLARGPEASAPEAAPLEPAAETEIRIGSSQDLGERLRLEVERCSRYGVPTSFLAIQATEWKDPSPEGVRSLDRFVLSHFTSGLRPSDGIYRFGYPGCYLLVLAGTTVQGAEVVRTRLLRRVEYSPQGQGAVEIFAIGPDAQAPDLPSLVNLVAARLRKASPLPLEGRCPVEIPVATKAAGMDAFLRRLKMEASLAVRNGFELQVIGISAEVVDETAPDLLVRHVFEAGARTLRPTDGVYAIGPRHCAVLCPCTDGEQAATVAHRLATAVRKRDPDAPYGQLTTQVVGLGPSYPDATSLLEALAKRRPA